jgi:subtilisin family serine protease
MKRAEVSLVMAHRRTLAVCIIVAVVLLLQLSSVAAETASAKFDSSKKPTRTTYIVQMSASSMPAIFENEQGWYTSVLHAVKLQSVQELQEAVVHARSTTTTTPGQELLLHMYTTVFHGFSAMLTESEAQALKNTHGVLDMYPDSVKQLHTTHTPEFLGLNSLQGLWPESSYGADVIVGLLDTGIWPERFSFVDQSLGPVPARWRGGCEAGTAFTVSNCNRKLIGAKFFCKGYEAMTGPINETLELRSPRDSDGHGTHTASTAAGRDVYPASLLGYAAGTARGMAPEARIAAYKVCWAQGCFDSDILAAFDQAVLDGVDVISLSVGGAAVPYFRDSIAIGAFGAMKKGIFVACSAGNSGPIPLSVANVSPWVTTVGASTVDRNFPANVILSNGETIHGVSLYSGPGLGDQSFPLIYAGDAAGNGSDPYSASLCMTGSLDPGVIARKIVVCDRGTTPRVAKGQTVLALGGAGMILANMPSDGEGLIADAHVLPATAVGALEAATIKHFIKSESLNPSAMLTFGGTQLNVRPAPLVASFSSRGPNPQTPEILKPDLIGPGVNILAAWTGDTGPTGLALDDRRVRFNIISGTSMSCPHISGLAALLKAAHPDWSPAAIRSALMTTASISDNTHAVMHDEATGNVSTPFDFGAGLVQPQKATDPGLIYDLGAQDYVNFLCGLNYSAPTIQLITSEVATICPPAALLPQDLNYPSLSVVFNQQPSSSSSSSILSTTLTRTVTNVGQAQAVYTATVLAPNGVKISVLPSTLSFAAVNQKLSFTVQVTATSAAAAVNLAPGDSLTVFGFLTWSDNNTHLVQSPISITIQQPF